MIEPLKVVELPVDYRGQKKTLPIVVTSESGPLLMGRNWLRELQLDWKGIMAEIYPVEANKEHDFGSARVNDLVKEYKDVFSENAGYHERCGGQSQTEGE